MDEACLSSLDRQFGKHEKNGTVPLESDLLSTSKKIFAEERDIPYNENIVNIAFRNISYDVQSGIFRKKKKQLLNNASGDFHSSKLTAIMGPSGAGKTTLMNILAGYTTHGVTGEIYINDHIRDESLFRKQSCYIMQDDYLQPLLTAYEAMTVAANLKLSNCLSGKQKNDRVKEILDSMGLWSQRKIQTIDLSGGQKKRLSIALELITNPQFMFFDEPTSGLDSVSSKQCVLLLKRLAALNRTIICIIHQPTAMIYNLFDHLYVVSNGSGIYQGSVSGLLPYLGEIHIACPRFHNPADFLLEVLNGDHGNYDEILLQKYTNDFNQQGRSQSQIKSSDKAEKDDNRQSFFETELPSRDFKTCTKRKPSLSSWSYSASLSSQIIVLMKRNFLVILRNKTLTLNRILTHLLIALFIGCLYFGIGREAADILNNFKFMFFSVMFLMLTAFNCVITTFPSELPIIIREHFNKWYSLKSYYLALTFADIPIQIVATLLYGSITYFLTMQPPEPFRIISFLFMCVLISMVTQSFGLFIGSFMDVKNGVILGPFCFLPFTIFSGFFVQLSACHPSMRWLFHISFLKYGFEGLTLSVFGHDRPQLPCHADYCHYVRPDKFLSTMDMSESTYLSAVIFLLGLILMIRIGAYFILKFQVRRSRRKRC